MTRQMLEKGLLFMQCWKESSHLGEQAMLAVAFALRNRHRAGWEGGDWLRIIQNCNRIRYNELPPNTGMPDLRDPTIYRVLTKIDTTYDGSAADTFTSSIHPTNGPRTGKYWAELDKITDKAFLEKIVRNPTAHPKTSTVGSLTFFA